MTTAFIGLGIATALFFAVGIITILLDATLWALIVTWMHVSGGWREGVTRWQKVSWMTRNACREFRCRMFGLSRYASSVSIGDYTYTPMWKIEKR